MAEKASGVSQQNPWRRRPRVSGGEFRPGPMDGKPSLKSLEVEIKRHAQELHGLLSKDLDILHEQVHSENYNAISQELIGVAQKLTAIRSEAHSDIENLKTNQAALAAALTELKNGSEDAKAEQGINKEVSNAQMEIQQLRESLSDVLARSEEQLREEMEKRRQELREELREEMSAQLTGFGERLSQDQASRLNSVETQIREELSAEASKSAKMQGEFAKTTEAGIAEARQEVAAADLRAKDIAKRVEVTSSRMEEVWGGLEELKQSVTAHWQAQADSKKKEAAASSASMEERLTLTAEQSAERCQQLETQVSELAQQMGDRMDTALKDLRQLGSECREGLGFAHNCWARTIDWTPTVDLAELESNEKCELHSPLFNAAGLRGLQLRLRLVPAIPLQFRYPRGC